MKKRRRKLDYQKKDLRNPYFDRRKKFNFKKWFFAILVLIIVIIGIRFVISSPIFLVENIEIQGSKTINQEELKTIAYSQIEKNKFFIFPQNNIFFFDNDKLEKNINEKYILENLKVSKSYFDTIVIKLKETVTSVVLLTTDKAYYLDLSGKIISEVHSLQQDNTEDNVSHVLRTRIVTEDLPVLYNELENNIQIGDSVYEDDLINYIIDLNNEIIENNLTINYYRINPENKDEVWAKTTQGYDIYFSREIEISEQIINLITILEERIENQNDLEYIDLRYGNKVFYK